MKKRNLLCLFLIFGIGIQSVYAQHKLSGKVYDEQEQALQGVVLSLLQDTTMVGATLTDASGNYAFGNLDAGTYKLLATAIGLQSQEGVVEVQSDTKRNLTMAREQILMDEVQVVADRSQVVTPTAKGTTFHLSNRAKSLSDPYEALQDIPKLLVIPSERKIQLVDGSDPLILVNGNRFNGGIESIDPKNVEAIEIIENPSARYLQEGITAIVNVKVKSRVAPYQIMNLNTKHSIPAFFGNSNAYYEIGNSKASMNITGQHWYFHHDDATTHSLQRNVGYEKQSESSRRWNAQNVYLALNADWTCSPKDYLALQITYINNPSEYTGSGQGLLKEEGKESQHFILSNRDKVSYYINSYNLYHKHTFNNATWLETTARFNLNGNSTEGNRTEDYASWDYDETYDFDNYRHSGGLEIYFTTPLGNQTLEVANNLSFLSDQVRQVTDASLTFRHRNWDEYVYAGLSGALSKNFTYALSLGYEFLFRKVGETNYDYIKPAGNLALNYRLNAENSLGASYQLSHTAPAVGYLNPYNTSTDSLMVQHGNPYLLPSQTHQWSLNYMYNHQGLFLQPTVSYTLVADAVEATGQTDEQTGVYYSTYENTDRYSFLSGRLDLGYNSPKWGRIAVGIENLTRFYQGQSGKNLFRYSLNFNARYKKFSCNGYVFYTPKDYGVNTLMKNRGAESEFSLNYRLNPNFSLSGGVRYWLGTLKNETYTTQGSYYSESVQTLNDRSWKFLLGISYHFSKEKYQYREKKYLQSTEEGIKL